MKLLLQTDAAERRTGEPFTVRLLAVHDGREPTWFDRRLLVGPNPILAVRSAAFPVSMDPPLPDDDWSEILLTPFCLYGRERIFQFDRPGQVAFRAYLLAERTDRLLADRPAERDPVTSAAPLVVTIAA